MLPNKDRVSKIPTEGMGNETENTRNFTPIYIGSGLKTYAFTVIQISFLVKRLKWKIYILQQHLEELLANTQ
jgi:hypothetical protein